MFKMNIKIFTAYIIQQIHILISDIDRILLSLSQYYEKFSRYDDFFTVNNDPELVGIRITFSMGECMWNMLTYGTIVYS